MWDNSYVVSMQPTLRRNKMDLFTLSEEQLNTLNVRISSGEASVAELAMFLDAVNAVQQEVLEAAEVVDAANTLGDEAFERLQGSNFVHQASTQGQMLSQEGFSFGKIVEKAKKVVETGIKILNAIATALTTLPSLILPLLDLDGSTA